MEKTTAGTPSRLAPLDSLTGLRFIAATAVFLFHSGAGFAERVGAPAPLVQLLHNGFAGVSLFFILSGFILTYTYSEHFVLNKSGLRAFFLARFARIYPIYLTVLLLMLPLVFDLLTIADAIRVLTMTQSWTLPASEAGWAWVMQAWTLSVELAFYLAFPIFITIIRPLGERTLFIGALACGFLMTAGAIAAFAPGTNQSGPIAFIPIPIVRGVEFIYGIFIGQIFLRIGSRLSLSANAMAIAAIVGAMVIILGATSNPHLISFAMVLIGPLLILLGNRLNMANVFLGSKVMVLLGGASYAFYLVQQPVREWLRVVPGESLEQILNPFVLLTVSLLLFLLVEEPARTWIRRRSKRAASMSASIQHTVGTHA